LPVITLRLPLSFAGTVGKLSTILSDAIKQIPEWGRIEDVELSGEFRFPGRYRVSYGEPLKSVVALAGGLTLLAFADGAVFPTSRPSKT